MSENVLGYQIDKNGFCKPIWPIEKGKLATCAFVICSDCRKAIRSMGGPLQNAFCLDCVIEK